MSLRRIKRTFHRHLQLDRYMLGNPGSEEPPVCTQCSNNVQSPTATKDRLNRSHHPGGISITPQQPFCSHSVTTKDSDKNNKIKDKSDQISQGHHQRLREHEDVVTQGFATDSLSANGDGLQVQQQQQQQQQEQLAQASDVSTTNVSTINETIAKQEDHPLSWKRFVNNQGQVQVDQRERNQGQAPASQDDYDDDNDDDQPTISTTATTILGLPPCYVSCFSPLDLPADLFVYWLEFLSSGDLWRLCQVSTTMSFEVRRNMPKIQRFGFRAVKILYQENEEELRARFEAEQSRKAYGERRVPAASGEYSMTPTYNSFMPYFGQNHHHQQQQQQQPPQEHQPQSPPMHSYPLRASQHQQHLHRPRPPLSRNETRSTYWSEQSGRFMALLSTHTTFSTEKDETAPEDPLEVNDEEEWTMRGCSVMSSSSSFPTSFVPSKKSRRNCQQKTTATSVLPSSLPPWPPNAAALPLDRFKSMVGLLFDPNLVPLHHRRAVINCARYVTASIEDGFGPASKLDDPIDAPFAVKMVQDCTVALGQYLHMLSPPVAITPATATNSERIQKRTKVVAVRPPARLTNYFQMMLWHRCLSDLIALYNKIQRRHASRSTLADLSRPSSTIAAVVAAPMCTTVPSPPLSRSINRPSAGSFATRSNGNNGNNRSCSCEAHLSTLTTQYPYNIVPNTVRSRFRQAFQKLCTISSPHRRRNRPLQRRSHLSLGSMPSSAASSTTTLVPSVGDSDLGGSYNSGCNVSTQSLPITGSDTSSTDCCAHRHRNFNAVLENEEQKEGEDTDMDVDGDYHQEHERQQQEAERLRRALEEETLIYQRYRIEERVRQDNLIKQELLSLCHMACGLFLSDDNRPFSLVRTLHQQPLVSPTNPVPTIMTLLRQNGPWHKGLWREGEWRRSPIQIEDEIDELSINRHLQDQEQEQDHPEAQQQQSDDREPRSRARGFSFSSRTLARATVKELTDDQGPWQTLCLATIDFLSSESLFWGGNQTNAELSKLRATSMASSWVYHE